LYSRKQVLAGRNIYEAVDKRNSWKHVND
jgi:hypothetical protein